MIGSILFLIGVFIVGYVVSGYAPDRALKLKAEEIFFIGIKERILFEIRVTKNIPWWLSVVPLPWPFRHVWSLLKWGELVRGKDKKTEKVKGTEDAKFKDIETFDTEPDMFYGIREELVPSLRIYEQVSYKITVRSKNKHTLYFVFTVFIFVKEGMKTVGRPNFKLVGEIDIQTKLGPWALGKTTDDVLDTDIDRIKKVKDGIKFEDDEYGTIDIVTFLNKKLKSLGCEVYTIALRIIPGKDVEDYFKESQYLAELAQAKKNQMAQEELRKKERLTELEDAKNQASIAEVEFNAYADPMKDLIGDIYEKEATLASKRPNVMVEANHEAGRIGVAAINALMEEVGKATNKSAGKQRREEEQAHA